MTRRHASRGSGSDTSSEEAAAVAVERAEDMLKRGVGSSRELEAAHEQRKKEEKEAERKNKKKRKPEEQEK